MQCVRPVCATGGVCPPTQPPPNTLPPSMQSDAVCVVARNGEFTKPLLPVSYRSEEIPISHQSLLLPFPCSPPLLPSPQSTWWRPTEIHPPAPCRLTNLSPISLQVAASFLVCLSPPLPPQSTWWRPMGSSPTRCSWAISLQFAATPLLPSPAPPPPAVYLVAPNGEFTKLWPKDVSIALLRRASCVARRQSATALGLRH